MAFKKEKLAAGAAGAVGVGAILESLGMNVAGSIGADVAIGVVKKIFGL